MNKWLGIGRWCKEIELRFSQSGTAVANCTIAIDRPPRQGQEKQSDFLRVVMLGKLAENVSKYSGKGRLVAVEGSIQTRSYDGNDGQKRYVTEILASNVQFLDYPKEQGQAQGQAYEPGDDDDLGF